MDAEESGTSCLCHTWNNLRTSNGAKNEVISSKRPEFLGIHEIENELELLTKNVPDDFSCCTSQPKIDFKFIKCKDDSQNENVSDENSHSTENSEIKNFLSNNDYLSRDLLQVAKKFNGLDQFSKNSVINYENAPLLQSRKSSLPIAVSEPEVRTNFSGRSNSKNFKAAMFNSPLQTFARCGRSRVPRVTYCQSQDSHTVTSGDERPIYPSLPYSPFCSPNSSPNAQRREHNLCRRISLEPQSYYTQLNQYRLKGEIGRGSFGIVQLACNVEDNSHYAIKMLSKRKLYRRAGLYGRAPPSRDGKKTRVSPLEQIHREIAILKKLNHPNIVKLHEVLDNPDEDNLYMVFELVEMGPVIQLPTNNPLSEMQAWQYFRDIVMGIEYLHCQKIIHRDIKPSNLLLSNSGRIQISDFGVCNQFEGVDAFLSDTAGTPAFVPPEALKGTGKRYSGKALDIWQMGVSLYSFVYGHVPFEESNILALYTKIKSQPISFPSDKSISDTLKDLLNKMLEKDPDHRITLLEIKHHPWVTKNDLCPLPSEHENCKIAEVTEDDINNCIKLIPKLDTLVLVKSMLKKHSFYHPFRESTARGKKMLSDTTLERKVSIENMLPALIEVNIVSAEDA